MFSIIGIFAFVIAVISLFILVPITTEYRVTSLFSQTDEQIIINTNDEVSLFDGGRGSLIIRSNDCEIGKTFRIKASGYVSISNGNEVTLRTKFGEVELYESVASVPATFTDRYFDLEWIMTYRSCGVNGSIIGNGRSLVEGGQGFATNTMRSMAMFEPIEIDTTKDNQIDMTYQYKIASVNDYLVITTASVETFN